MENFIKKIIKENSYTNFKIKKEIVEKEYFTKVLYRRYNHLKRINSINNIRFHEVKNLLNALNSYEFSEFTTHSIETKENILCTIFIDKYNNVLLGKLTYSRWLSID